MFFARKKHRITRLLVVEDEPLVAFDNEHLLSDAGFEIVATVDRVAEATNILGADVPIDLVLVDVSLADGSGLAVAQVARTRGTPVMFVTGNCPPEASEIAIGCLAKPYAPRDLLAAINAVAASIDGEQPKRLPPGFRLFVRA